MGMPGAARPLSRPPRWLVQGVLMRPLGTGQATTKGGGGLGIGCRGSRIRVVARPELNHPTGAGGRRGRIW